MLYETLNQPLLLLIFLTAGVVGGFIFDAGNYIKFLFSNKKAPYVVIDFIETSMCLGLLFFVNLKYNYGQVRLFPALIFFIFFSLERITIGKMLAKIYISCYNLLRKAIKKNTQRKNK